MSKLRKSKFNLNITGWPYNGTSKGETIKSIEISIGENKEYLCDKIVKLPVNIDYAEKFKEILMDPNFSPVVEFYASESRLEFSGIKQVQDPEVLVEKEEYGKAKDSIHALTQFMDNYPNSIYAPKAKARISFLEKEAEIEAVRQAKLEKEQKAREAKERAGKAEEMRIAREKAEREFLTLGPCQIGITIYHREKWNTKTSSGNVIVDTLFNASTKEEFIITYEAVIEGFVGDKVKATIIDYRVQQTQGGGWLLPKTYRKYDLAKHADKYIGKVQFYDRSRCE